MSGNTVAPAPASSHAPWRVRRDPHATNPHSPARIRNSPWLIERWIPADQTYEPFLRGSSASKCWDLLAGLLYLRARGHNPMEI